jgi:tetratricopeptide (TPR) repeat protein
LWLVVETHFVVVVVVVVVVSSDLAALKPDWRPKADIPSAVPKLPIEYIHRHRLMKQVVSCLLEQTGAGPRDTDEESHGSAVITSITSRHGDKAGNGKTILAVAAIQTVEVRERFSDGIAWIQLGRGPFNERDIRRLYEELYRQLIIKDADIEDDLDDDSMNPRREKGIDAVPSRDSSFEGGIDRNDANKAESRKHRIEELAESRRRFQGGDIEGIQEDLGRLLSDKKVLICLDDVWRVEDAKWFIFDSATSNGTKPAKRGKGEDPHPCRVLMTTRTPSLLGPGMVQEVFVRILSEHEAVKLLLSTSGRRPYGGKNSAVFNQAKLIVKGCGNSPLAVRLAGSMLRQSNRSWNISSPAWSTLIHQCRLNLEEASQLRSFVNAVNRVVDLSFFTVGDVRTRVALRRCFVAFAMAFRDNDWMLSGKGIPQSVLLRVFRTIISSDKSSKDVSSSQILSMLEKLNLIERARHGCSARSLQPRDSPSTSGVQREESDRSDSDWGEEDEPTRKNGKNGHQQLFVMHASVRSFGLSCNLVSFTCLSLFLYLSQLKAVAEEMAQRNTPTLSPDADDFTSYLGKIEEERKLGNESNSMWTAPLRFLAQQFGNTPPKPGFHDDEAHKLVVTSLLNIGGGFGKNGSVSEALKGGQVDIATIAGGDRMEEYLAAFLPSHLMKCHAFTSAAEILSEAHFIGRRVHALGIVEATSRHVADLQELRRVGGNITIPVANKQLSTPKKAPDSLNALSPGDISDEPDELPTLASTKFDVNGVVRDGSRIMIDEVYRVANKAEGASDSLGMAMCLAAVGDGLLKSRQPRDAMLRLEEAVGIYRDLLGPHHTNVRPVSALNGASSSFNSPFPLISLKMQVADALHLVAKALVKLGETRVALLKFAEAARIYEACNATLHYNSIANAQSLATLLVDLGDMDKAQSMFEEVISMRRTVYGNNCVPVAKTINAYAILLAKHGLMNHALQNYEAAKITYESVPTQLIKDPEFDIKCKYDVTLINLNIASIRSKKGDLKAAIAYYEEGVQGLREYEAAQAEIQKEALSTDSGKNTAHKHLVAALGRIGSLKLKYGDNDGALEAYMTLLGEVKEDSPPASHTEKAKAHIKCATIYRQQEGADSHAKSISHLREALDMYTAIFGPDHKDTLAIASSLRQWLSEDRKE